MLNGRFDFFVPTDSFQEPMFRLLGVPDAQKRRVVYETGHNIPRPEMVRETLDWLDRHLGAEMARDMCDRQRSHQPAVTKPSP